MELVSVQDDLFYGSIGQQLRVKFEQAIQKAEEIKLEFAKVSLAPKSHKLPTQYQTLKATMVQMVPVQKDTVLLKAALKMMHKHNGSEEVA